MNTEPQEPTTHARADELLGYLSALEAEMNQIQDSLAFSIDATNDSRPAPFSLDQKVADACARTASLLSFAQTMTRRLGFPGPPPGPKQLETGNHATAWTAGLNRSTEPTDRSAPINRRP